MPIWRASVGCDGVGGIGWGAGPVTPTGLLWLTASPDQWPGHVLALFPARCPCCRY